MGENHRNFLPAGELYQQEYVPVIEELMSDDSAKVREALVTNIKPVVALIGQQMFVSTFQVGRFIFAPIITRTMCYREMCAVVLFIDTILWR